MQIITITSTPLPYSLCPTLYSIRLKSTQSPHPLVVLLQTLTSSLDLTTWQDLRLQLPSLTFKVISFTNPASITYHTVDIKPMFTKVVVSEETSFVVETVEINRVGDGKEKGEGEGEEMYKMGLVGVEGYEEFVKFRKKVKKLQNLTSSLEWKISCRVKVVQNNKVIDVLEINPNSKTTTPTIPNTTPHNIPNKDILINLNNGPIRILTEQLSWLSSPQDHMLSTISDNSLPISSSCQTLFKFSQYLTLKFRIQKLITNQISSFPTLMSIRILQSFQPQFSTTTPSLKLTFKNPHPLVQTLSPPLEPQFSTTYYDLEYYYLKKNLEDTLSNSSQQSASGSEFKVFQQLRQLTPAFPDYPHIKNQILLPITTQSSSLTLQAHGHKQELKLFQLMQGLNSIRLGLGYIRFFIEFSPSSPTPPTPSKPRLFRIKLHSIYNLPATRPLKLKILNNNNILSYDFHTTEKQLKNLIYQNEFSKSHQLTLREPNKPATVLTKSDKYYFTEIPEKEYYVREELVEEEMGLAMVGEGESVLYSGVVKMNRLKEGGDEGEERETIIVPLQSTAKENKEAYCYVKLQYEEIVKEGNSVKSLYKIAYNLSPVTPTPQTSHSPSVYQLKLTNLSNNSKQHKQKLSFTPHFSSTPFLLISPTSSCQLHLTLRKYYLDQICNEYLHLSLVDKTLSLNSPSSLPDDNFLRIPPNQYQILQETFENEHGQTISLKLQITHLKDEFIDREDSRYSIQIPKPFWQSIKREFKNINSITFEVLSSKKTKRGSHKQKRGSKTKELTYLDSSQFQLTQTDYRDSLSVRVNQTQVGYSKFIDLLSAKIQYPSTATPCFTPFGQYTLALINIKQTLLPFIFTFKSHHPPSSDNQSTRTLSNPKAHSRNKSVNLNKTTKFQSNNIHLQKQINNLVQQNRMLVTQAVRVESQNTILHQKIQELEGIAKRQKMELKYNKKSGGKRSAVVSKNAAKYRAVCACGGTENLYKGYCQPCLKELEKTYGIVYKLFEQKASAYETIYFQKVLKKQKTQKLTNKIETLKRKLLMKQALEQEHSGSTALTESLSYHQTIDKISSLKNEIFTLSLKTKNSIESSSTLQETLETKINQTNKSIFSMMQQIQQYKVKMKDLEGKIKQYKEGSSE